MRKLRGVSFQLAKIMDRKLEAYATYFSFELKRHTRQSRLAKFQFEPFNFQNN
jgi:hypothetical protein